MSIKLESVSYTYMPGTPYEQTAINDISLEIEKGEFLAIIGHTGSGKSTLVQHLNGLLHPTSGRVLVNGVDLAAKTPEAKQVRHTVGMVFQYPEHQLFAETIYEDIAFGPRNLKLDEAEVRQRVELAMEFVGLDYKIFAERSPFQLSGGQMRRVAIAGVIAMHPDYLILDEPSAGLDPAARNAIFAEIVKLHRTRGTTVILVTHNMEEAARLADRMLVLAKGKVLLEGKPKEVFRADRALLHAAGVDVPRMVELVDTLRKHGVAIPDDTISVDGLVREILAGQGRGSAC